MVSNAIFLPIGIVRVTGTECIDQIGVISAAGVLVSDEQRDGSASGLALKDTRENFNGVGFLPLRDVAGRARAAAIEFDLDVRFG